MPKWLVVMSLHSPSTDMFNFIKMDDPFLGDGTFGQLARLGPERCAVMHILLSELERGGWKGKVEFKPFIKAYNTVAGDAEKKYLDKAVDVFLRRFRAIFEKHMVSKWTSTEIVHYILGGDPHHAKEFACWLVYHHHNKEKSPDEVLAAEHKTEEFFFDTKVVTLGKHHRRYHDNKIILEVNIDLHQSMNFITKNAEPFKILDDPFIKRNWEHIESLAMEMTAVNIWDRKSSASFEKYSPFRLDIIFSICIHSSHQQQCENYVQLCGLLALTGVGEVRRTCRAIVNSILHHRFNPWALRYSNARREKSGKKLLNRVQGAERLALFHEFANEFFKNADEAKRFAPELWKSVRARFNNGSMKASNTEKLCRIEKFNESLKKQPKNVKAVQPMGIEQTVHMLAKVKLSILTKSNNSYLRGTGMDIEDLVKAELEARGLDTTIDKASSLKQKRDTIQAHEHGRLLQEDPLRAVDVVREFHPMSDKMKLFLESGYQTKILDKDKADPLANED